MTGVLSGREKEDYIYIHIYIKRERESIERKRQAFASLEDRAQGEPTPSTLDTEFLASGTMMR